MLYCFLDTNIFLEFKHIKEVNWVKELDSSAVCLVITSVVVRELDKHKTSNRNRLRKRAHKTLTFIESLDTKKDNTIRENVDLRFDLSEPKRATIDHNNLSTDVADDILIAKALEFANQHRDYKVAIVTDDAAVRLKSRGFDIDAKQLSEGCRLPDETDPLEKENRELRNENQRLQNAQPKLHLGFQDSSGKLVNCEYASNDFSKSLVSEVELDDLLQTVRVNLQSFGKEQPIDYDQSSFLATLPTFLTTVTKSQMDEYYRNVDKYLESYREYLLDNSLAVVFPHRSIELSFVLKNEGSAPAQNVEVRLDSSGCSDILLNVPEMPQDVPTPPAKPKPRPPLGISTIDHGIVPYFGYGTNSNVIESGPLWEVWKRETDNSGAAWFNYRIAKLQHHRSRDIQSIYVMVDNDAEFPATVTIEYEITADNMVKILNGSLTVVVNKDSK